MWPSPGPLGAATGVQSKPELLGGVFSFPIPQNATQARFVVDKLHAAGIPVLWRQGPSWSWDT